MNRTAVALLAAALVAAPTTPAARAAPQGMPGPSLVERYVSSVGQSLLKIEWDGAPAYEHKKNPDGSAIPPKAPWPFLIYVKGGDSKESARIQSIVFGDARVALAAKAVHFVQSSPERAIDLPYLKGVNGIKDPTLLVVDRDFKLLGMVNEWKDFDERAVLPLLVKAADAVYPIKLAAFVGGMVEQLQVLEELWKKEKRIDELQKKIGKSNDVKQKALDAECDKLNHEIEAGTAEVDQKVKALQAQLAPKEAAAAATPTTFGSGRSKRKLTPAEVEAIESFREFARNENPIVRAAAVEDLGAVDSPAIVEVILDACSDVDPRVIEAAGRGLGKMSSDESLRAMVDALDGSTKVRAAVAFGFAKLKRPWPPAVPKLAALLNGGDDDVRRAVLQALANMKDPATTDALIAGLDDKIPALRVLAVQALGELKQAKAVPGLVAALAAPDWTLQKAAAEALGKIRSRDAIGPLIDRFEVESGVVVEAIYAALVDTTGEDHTLEAKHWRKWWDLAGKDFKVPSDADLAKLKERIAAAMLQYKGPGKKTYHFIETLSKRMIFVIDVSSSMGDKIPIPDTATQEQIDAFGSRVKMDIAKNELIALLSTLPDDVEFNIITFAGVAKPWQGGLVGTGSRAAAIKFVSKLQPMQAPEAGARTNSRGAVTGSDDQKTNTYGALLAAFGFADEGNPNWKTRGKVDTIFFVTDGLPTTGQIVDVPKMIEAITDLNRTRGLTIHLVMFDKNAALRLRPLAEQNGGKCVVRSLETK